MYKIVIKSDYIDLLSQQAVKIVNTPMYVHRKMPLIIYKESRFDKYVLARDNEVPDDSKFNFDVLGYSLKEVTTFFEDIAKEKQELEDYFDITSYLDNAYEGIDRL